MQFPESWLREFCNPPLNTAELGDLLTMAGMEVEELRPAAPPFTGVVGGVNLRRDIGRAGVQGRTGFVRTRRARGCAGPLQGQAEHQQQGKQAGTHQGCIVG